MPNAFTFALKFSGPASRLGWLSLLAAGCVESCTGSETPGGGTGGSGPGAGGANATGGVSPTTGGVLGSGGSPATGGAVSSGGTPSASGGIAATGGASTGGVATGGTPTGGKATGGVPIGGSATGGTSTGGTATGGRATGGSATGGRGTAGTTGTCGSGGSGPLGGLPKRSEILSVMVRANTYFMGKWPDMTRDFTVGGTSRPSNIWTRGVYFEGLMGLYGIETDATRKTGYSNYAVQWGASPTHAWQIARGDTNPRNADNQCCGQTYIDLYNIEAQAVRVADIKTHIDAMVSGSASNDWTWIDAIQMSMPVFAKLGALFSSSGYFDKMHALYVYPKTSLGLYNTTDHLWWRDTTFKPPTKTPNGQQVYWSRGNGWVFAALTRVLDAIPTTAAYRAEYVSDFTAMASKLATIQRTDGFWNVSLADPNDYGGPETTGTALFTYGMAWGISAGLLDVNVYGPVVTKGWCALASAVHTDSTAAHPSGFLGYVQGTGSKPADSQPVTFTSIPDFDDFGLGCFLLGGSEAWQLASP
jgi:unsaturated rhamnogalacturonyl hydrolase